MPRSTLLTPLAGALAGAAAALLLTPLAHTTARADDAPSPAPAQTSAADPGPTIAVCAVPTLINELMASDRFAPEREELTEERQAEIEELRREIADLEDELRALDQNDPTARDVQLEWRRLGSELARATRAAQRAYDELYIDQIKRAYTLARSSANAVADALGFDYVLSTGDPREELTDASADALLRQITARPVVRSPEGVDITDDVRRDLNLD